MTADMTSKAAKTKTIILNSQKIASWGCFSLYYLDSSFINLLSFLVLFFFPYFLRTIIPSWVKMFIDGSIEWVWENGSGPLNPSTEEVISRCPTGQWRCQKAFCTAESAHRWNTPHIDKANSIRERKIIRGKVKQDSPMLFFLPRIYMITHEARPRHFERNHSMTSLVFSYLKPIG